MDSGYFYGGFRPPGQAPPVNYSQLDNTGFSRTDYVLTSFEEYKMVTAQRLQELESKLANVKAELEELKEVVKRSDTALDSKGRKTRRRIPKEILVSTIKSS